MRCGLRLLTVWISSSAMILGLFGASAMARTLVVKDDGDVGRGTLRAAIDRASRIPRLDKIEIDESVNTIRITESLVYTGRQSLRIEGNGVVIEPVAGSEGAFDLFVSLAGASLELTGLTFGSGANGISVPVSANATDDVSVTLEDVVIQDCARFGLHIDDQTNNSMASVLLDVSNSTVTNNGIGELDFDGIRVDEGGPGSITAHVVDSHVDGNGGDGLELDERGLGDVDLDVEGSTFDGNGFFDEEDLDDGLDIDEADGGSLRASFVDCSFSNNFDEGLDLDEELDGDMDISLALVQANDNLDEGIKIDEKFDDDEISADGDLTVTLVLVNASGSAEEEGIALTEEGAGSFDAYLLGVAANGNAKEGVDIAEEGPGDLTALLYTVFTLWNGDDGIQAEEAEIGNLLAVAVDVVSRNNAEFGMKVVQEVVGAGLLILQNATLEPNEEGPLETDEVIVIGS